MPVKRSEARNSTETGDLDTSSLNAALNAISGRNEHLLSSLVANKKIKHGLLKPRSSISESHIVDPSLKRRCERTVFRNKYERNALEIRSWWNDLFKSLEYDAVIPPEEQLPVLRDMFGTTMLLKVLQVCKTRKKLAKEPEVYVEDDLLDLRRNVRPRKHSVMSSSKEIEFSNKSLVDPEDHRQIRQEFDENTRRGTYDSIFIKQDAPKSQMYHDFFKRKPSRAAVWRTLPPLTMDEMNLNQKADAITEQIATDFIDWLRDLGGDEQLSLNVQSIIEMFEVGFHANSANSLKVNVKEMPSVPKRVALAKNLPLRVKRTFLRKEIQKDVRASKKKTTYTAFGTRLPDDMQVRIPAENYYRKWMSCDRVPEKLATMAAVWQGITHLKSTRAFCKFLKERPEITPPQFLVECGMMDMKNLEDKEKEKQYNYDEY